MYMCAYIHIYAATHIIDSKAVRQDAAHALDDCVVQESMCIFNNIGPRLEDSTDQYCVKNCSIH